VVISASPDTSIDLRAGTGSRPARSGSTTIWGSMASSARACCPGRAARRNLARAGRPVAVREAGRTRPLDRVVAGAVVLPATPDPRQLPHHHPHARTSAGPSVPCAEPGPAAAVRLHPGGARLSCFPAETSVDVPGFTGARHHGRPGEILMHELADGTRDGIWAGTRFRTRGTRGGTTARSRWPRPGRAACPGAWARCPGAAGRAAGCVTPRRRSPSSTPPPPGCHPEPQRASGTGPRTALPDGATRQPRPDPHSHSPREHVASTRPVRRPLPDRLSRAPSSRQALRPQ